jgi:hypothetical protein
LKRHYETKYRGRYNSLIGQLGRNDKINPLTSSLRQQQNVFQRHCKEIKAEVRAEWSNSYPKKESLVKSNISATVEELCPQN